MNFGGYVSRRQPGDFCDRGGVESLQVGENHVPIHRFETLNEIQQAFESMAAVCGLEGIRRIRKILQFFQPDERLIPEAPLPQNMRSSDIVRHAIEPGAERASPIKSAEAPP